MIFLRRAVRIVRIFALLRFGVVFVSDLCLVIGLFPLIAIAMVRFLLSIERTVTMSSCLVGSVLDVVWRSLASGRFE